MSQLVSHARMLSGMLTVIILNSLPLTRSPFVSASLSVGLVCAQPLTSFVTFLFFALYRHTYLLTKPPQLPLVHVRFMSQWSPLQITMVTLQAYSLISNNCQPADQFRINSCHHQTFTHIQTDRQTDWPTGSEESR